MKFAAYAALVAVASAMDPCPKTIHATFYFDDKCTKVDEALTKKDGYPNAEELANCNG